MKKKILLIVMSLTLVLGLAACGGTASETDKAKKVADKLFEGIKNNEPNALVDVADKETKAAIEDAQKKQEEQTTDVDPEIKVKQDLVTKLFNRQEHTYISGEVAEGADSAELHYKVNSPVYTEYVNQIIKLSTAGTEITRDSIDVNAIPMKERDITVNMVKEDGEWKVKDPTSISTKILGLFDIPEAEPTGSDVTPGVDDNK